MQDIILWRGNGLWSKGGQLHGAEIGQYGTVSSTCR